MTTIRRASSSLQLSDSNTLRLVRENAMEFVKSYENLKTPEKLACLLNATEDFLLQSDINLIDYVKVIYRYTDDLKLKSAAMLTESTSSATFDVFKKSVLSARNWDCDSLTEKMKYLKQSKGESKRSYWKRVIRTFVSCQDPDPGFLRESAKTFARLTDPIEAVETSDSFSPSNVQSKVWKMIQAGILDSPEEPTTLKQEDRRRTNKSDNNKSKSNFKCFGCGDDSCKRSECPAKDKICGHCKKQGHFSKVCLMKSNSSNARTAKTDFP